MIFSFSPLIIPSASIYQSVLSDWQTMVDGFGGGGGASADPNQWLEDWMVSLVIGVIAVAGVIGLYIFLKMRKKGMGMSNININVNN